MSKNLTLKGIAFGALVALGSSVFAGTPATAAVSDSIVTGLTTGTSYNSVVGYANELSLSTVLSPSNDANKATLHYAVSNPSGAKLEIKVGTTNAAVAQITDGTANTAEVWATDAVARSGVDADSTAANMQTALTSFNVVPLGTQVGSVTYDNLLTIGVADADANVEVTVYAWLDSSSNAANVQAPTELYGNSVTLKFYDQANITATTEMVSPVTGAASVQATFSTTPELNGQQLGADFIDAAFTSQGNGNTVLAKNTSSDAAISPTLGTTTYSGTTKKWTATAYLKYSKATDAYRGTDGTLFSLADMDDNGDSSNEVTFAYTASTDTVELATFPHGLVASGGSWAITISDADTAAGTNVEADTDEVARAFTVTSATTGTYVATDPLTYKNDADFTATDAVDGAVTLWSVGTYATVQASGTYSFRPYIGTTALGAAGSSANSAITADDTKATIAVSTDVAAGSNADASANTNTGDTVEVRTGTTSVSASAVIYYTDATTGVVTVAPAGIPVTGYLTADNGTFQINAAGAGVTSDVEYTDANGKVTFTVTTTTASSTSNKATLEIRPQSIATNNAAGAKFTLEWDDAAYTIYDLKSPTAQPGSNAASYRRIATGGTYAYNFAVLDQWGKAADAAKYRLQVVNSGRTVSSDTHTLSNGRVNVSVADGAQGAGTSIQTTVNLQKDVSGTWTTQATESWDGTGFGYAIINVAAATTEAFTLDADGGTTYQSSYEALTADLVDSIAAVATAAQDRRTSKVNQPAYANAVTLNGRLTDKVTGQALGGGQVTISGDSSILFSSGNVDALGSITLFADADGDFGVNLYSTKSATDTVITFTSASGATKTQKVTFSAAAARTGAKLTVSAPSVAKAGRTLVITGTLVDEFGNGVDTDQDTTKVAGDATLDATDARLTVTYTGPGLVSTALPVETGADGKFTVRVLLGVGDSGIATVKATYGAANGTISSTDTGDNIDLTASASSIVGVSATVSAGSKKATSVVKGAEGLTVKVVSGSKSVTKIATSDSYKVSLTKLTAGKKTVKVYVEGVLVASKSVTVKK